LLATFGREGRLPTQRVNRSTQCPQPFYRALRCIDVPHARAYVEINHPRGNRGEVAAGQEDDEYIFHSLATTGVHLNLSVDERMEWITDRDRSRSQNMSSL
jgi:hypothetical protein